MAKRRTTTQRVCDKRNKYKIKRTLRKIVFEFLCNNKRQNRELCHWSIESISFVSDLAVRAIMGTDKIDVVVKKRSKRHYDDLFESAGPVSGGQ